MQKPYAELGIIPPIFLANKDSAATIILRSVTDADTEAVLCAYKLSASGILNQHCDATCPVLRR